MVVKKEKKKKKKTVVKGSGLLLNIQGPRDRHYKEKPTTQRRKFLKYTDNVFYNLFSLLKKETHTGNILKPSK